MLEIIDAHQHMWDLGELKLPWLVDLPPLDRSFLMRDYLQAAAGLSVVGSVYVEVDAADQNLCDEMNSVRRFAEDPKALVQAAVASARPGEATFDDELRRFASWPWIKGIRRVLHTPATPAGHCLRQPFLEDLCRAGQAGLSFDICIRRAELADAAAMIAACPDTPFMLDHCGNADVRWSPTEHEAWRVDISRIARLPNAWCKISGFAWTVRDQPWSPQTLAPVVRYVRDCFGPRRLVFGGDWPVVTLSMSFKNWVESLREIVSDWPEHEQKLLFADNARAFYRLDGDRA